MSTDNSRAIRLRGVPAGSNDETIKELVKRALSVGDDAVVNVQSLVDDPLIVDQMVATLELHPTPTALERLPADSDYAQRIGDAELLFDVHFQHFTLLPPQVLVWGDLSTYLQGEVGFHGEALTML